MIVVGLVMCMFSGMFFICGRFFSIRFMPPACAMQSGS